MAEEKEKKKEYLPITPRIVTQAKALWRSGEFATFKEVGAALGVNPLAISKHLDRKEKGADAAKIKERTEEAIVEEAVEAAAILKSRIRETKEIHYNMASTIGRLAYAEVVQARTAGLPMATIASNVRALENTMKVIKMAREERFAVLGLDANNTNDDVEMPQLVVSELTDTQVEELRNAQEDDDYIAADSTQYEDPDEGLVSTDDDEEPEETD